MSTELAYKIQRTIKHVIARCERAELLDELDSELAKLSHRRDSFPRNQLELSR